MVSTNSGRASLRPSHASGIGRRPNRRDRGRALVATQQTAERSFVHLSISCSGPRSRFEQRAARSPAVWPVATGRPPEPLCGDDSARRRARRASSRRTLRGSWGRPPSCGKHLAHGLRELLGMRLQDCRFESCRAYHPRCMNSGEKRRFARARRHGPSQRFSVPSLSTLRYPS